MSFSHRTPSLLTVLVSTASVAAVAVVVTGVRHLWFRSSSTEKGEIRRLPLVPMAPVGIIKALSEFLGDDAPVFLLDVAKQMQRYTYRLPIPLSWNGIFIISDAQLARKILTDETTDKTKSVHKAFDVVSDGPTMMMQPDTEYSRSLRKGTARAFANRRLSRIKKIAHEHAHQVVDRLLERQQFDPAAEMTRQSLLILCEAAFEYQATDLEVSNYSQDLQRVMTEFFLRQAVNPLRKYLTWFLPEVKKALQSRDEMVRFAKRVLLAYQAKRDAGATEENTVIQLIDSNGALQGNEAGKASEVVTWTFAGHDTTGFSLSNLLILLAQHPEVQEKLRKELADANEEQPHTVEYLQCVVREAGRMVPVVATGSVRTTGRDFVTDDHYLIPKNSICLFAQYPNNHNENIYGDPQVFRPERWLEQPDLMEYYMPFSAGRRNCVGQRLAMAELYTVLSVLVREVVKDGHLKFCTTQHLDGYRLAATRVV